MRPHLDVLGDVVEVQFCVVLSDVSEETAFVEEAGTTDLTVHPVQVTPAPLTPSGGQLAGVWVEGK